MDADIKFYSSNWKPDRGQSIPFGKVFWGEDVIAVDREACRQGQEPMPSYLDAIDRLRNLTLKK